MTGEYIYEPPPNTKRATGHKGKHTVWVECPHCGKIHHHHGLPAFEWLAVEAPCGIGHYTIHIEEGR